MVKGHLESTYFYPQINGEPVAGVTSSMYAYYNGTIFNVTITFSLAGAPLGTLSGSSPPQYGYLNPTFFIPFAPIPITFDPSIPGDIIATVDDPQFTMFTGVRVVLDQ